MARRFSQARVAAAIALCLVLALGGQALADSLVPEASGADTGKAVGRAASSYLTGLRTYAAAALWNRIDPLMHNYYSGVSLNDQRYMLTTISAVQALDPHMVQSYYVGSWILARNDRLEEGLDMAERGIEANPRAGILLVGLAQMRMVLADDVSGALEIAQNALADDTQWTDPTEQVDALLIVKAMSDTAGREDIAAQAEQIVLAVEAEHWDELGLEDHDHDGDGEQDH